MSDSARNNRVFVGRLVGAPVFDPLGDKLGIVRDVVVFIRLKGTPLAVGLVVEVAGRKRVFQPLTRVTAIDGGQVIITGLINVRRFKPRALETLVVSELFDREVELNTNNENGEPEIVSIVDVAISQQRGRDWRVTELYIRHESPGNRRGENEVIQVTQVKSLMRSDEMQRATTLLAGLEDMKPADLVEVLNEMPEDRRLQVASELPDERLADVLEEMSDDDRVEIMSGLDIERAADVLDVMQPDDAADLVAELPAETAAQLLGRMEPEEAADIRRLLRYAENTAGGMMTTEPIILSPETPVAAAIAAARTESLTPALASIMFVVRPPLETPTGRFLGVIHIQRAIRERPSTPVGQLVDTDVPLLSPDTGLGKVTRLLATYNLTALPVVDEAKLLIGAVAIDDVLDHILPGDWRDQDEDILDPEVDRSFNG